MSTELSKSKKQIVLWLVLGMFIFPINIFVAIYKISKLNTESSKSKKQIVLWLVLGIFIYPINIFVAIYKILKLKEDISSYLNTESSYKNSYIGSGNKSTSSYADSNDDEPVTVSRKSSSSSYVSSSSSKSSDAAERREEAERKREEAQRVKEQKEKIKKAKAKTKQHHDEGINLWKRKIENEKKRIEYLKNLPNGYSKKNSLEQAKNTIAYFKHLIDEENRRYKEKIEHIERYGY